MLDRTRTEGAAPKDAPVISRVWREIRDIRRKLGRLLDQPHTLRVVLRDMSYTSEVVAIVSSDDALWLVLDMLMPQDGNQWVRQRPEVRCETRIFHQGLEWVYRFQTRLEELFEHGGMLSIRARFPEWIEEQAYLYWAAFDERRPLYISFEVGEKTFKVPVGEISMNEIELEAELPLYGSKILDFSLIFPDGSREDFLGNIRRESSGRYLIRYEDASPVVRRKIAKHLEEIYSLPPRRKTVPPPSPESEEAKRVLIVDDEPEVVSILERMLHRLNYRTISAYNGEEALQKAKEDSPDLILLDLMMPGMSGEEVCTKLKEDPKTKDIPVLVLTAVRDISRLGDLDDLGAVGYIQKPFIFEELSDRLKAALEKKPLLTRPAQFKTNKVLLISGDNGLIKYIAGTLDPSRYVLLYLTDEIEAVWRALREKVGVVVIDADGLSISPGVVYKAFRRNPNAASIPLVVLTEDRNLKIGQEEDSVYLVFKPFEANDLEEALNWAFAYRPNNSDNTSRTTSLRTSSRS
ncbi:MAG: hypothetical protein DRP95_01575 [Candidatus Latescibacterota bacterium]|nr:MAG: hypothetical protein DRP95_01575 [Candidatus Latescibacterota bacterium]